MKALNNIVFTTVLLAAASCNFLEKEPYVIEKDTFYSSEKEVEYGLAGVYGVLNSGSVYGKGYSLDLSAVDDLCWYISANSNGTETNIYSHNAGTSGIYSVWTRLYGGIKNANAFMEAIEGTEFDSDGTMVAEARFLRAYYHFLLTQAWGDVPLKDKSSITYEDAHCAATTQYQVLRWIAAEMEECIDAVPTDLDLAPSRITKPVVQGILARVYLFMAGNSVNGGYKKDFYAKARDFAKAVIDSGNHQLNPDYSNVFIRMIKDEYDRDYRESMWEADFVGGPEDPNKYSSGYIGNYIGLRGRSSKTNFSEWNSGYAEGLYKGSMKLWDLYWKTDRIDSENALPVITDARQDWNLPPYNYQGGTSGYGEQYPFGGDPTDLRTPVANMDKNPYATGTGIDTNHNILHYGGNRDCGKWRREAIYEGTHQTIHRTTQINFPILRYSDILLMYAEAVNEAEGAPSEEAYNYVKAIRDRAGIGTRPFSEYSTHSTFREFVRNERGRELCFEALRKYDLIRWGIFEKSMKESYMVYFSDTRCNSFDQTLYAKRYATSVTSKHVLLPIPAIELGVNPNLRQNPMW